MVIHTPFYCAFDAHLPQHLCPLAPECHSNCRGSIGALPANNLRPSTSRSLALHLDELVLQTLQGNPDARSALLSHEQPRLRRIARRRFPASLCDDAVQEANVALLKSLGTFDPEYDTRGPSTGPYAAFRRWSHTIVVRSALRVAKHEARQPVTTSDISDVLDRTLEPGRVGERDLDREVIRVRALVDQRNTLDKAIFSLRIDCALDWNEIAEMLGLRAGSARSRWTRMRKRLIDRGADTAA